MTSAPPPSPAALERLEGYLAIDPANPALLMNAIDVALAAGNIAAARKHADAALRLQPEDPFVRHRHGSVLIAERRLDEAADVFAQLLSQHPDPNIAFNLAFVRFRQGRHADVAEVLRQEVEGGKAPARALVLYLRALHQLGETAHALVVIDTYAPRLQEDAEFLAVASLVALDEDRLEQAAAMSQAALATGARPLEAVVSAASVALTTGDLQNASRLFDEAVQAQPKDGRSWAGLGMASLLAGDPARAVAPLRRAVQLMPTHGDTLNALGWCEVMLGDLRAAQATFEKSKGLDARASEPWGGLAVVYAVQKQRAEAEAAIAAAESIDVSDAGAQLARAILSGGTADIQQMATRWIKPR